MVIPAGSARFAILTRQALADGIMDAALLQVYETRFRRAEMHDQAWLDNQAGKVARGLTALDERLPALSGTPDVGQIAAACALGYLDLRFAGDWRGNHPRLVKWLDTFADAVPSFETTRVAA